MSFAYSLLHSQSKRRKLVHPDHLKKETEETEKRLQDYEAAVASSEEAPRNLPRLSRHERELERSLLQGKPVNPLGQWLIEGTDHRYPFVCATVHKEFVPEKRIPSSDGWGSGDANRVSGHDAQTQPAEGSKNTKKRSRRKKSASADAFRVGTQDDLTEIVPLDQSLIKANRISESEIRRMPRFSSYEPGDPSCTLYIKNLAEGTTRADLARIFLSFQRTADQLSSPGELLEFRLLQVGLTLHMGH